MKKLFYILSLLTVVLLGGCIHKQINNDNVTTNTGTNEKITTSKGTYKFIGFVGTFCPHCQDAVPKLEKFYEEHPGIKMELNVLDKKKFKSAKTIPQNYTNPKQYQDYTHEQCGYIPSYVIVDKNNKIIVKKCGGAPTTEELKKYLVSKDNKAAKSDKKVTDSGKEISTTGEKENNNVNAKKQSGNNTQENQYLNTNKKQIMTEKVRIGDTVSVNYIGTFTDGKVFDTSLEDEAKKAGKYNSARTYEPLTFKAGAGQMIPCFDKAVIDMKVGETKDITCQPEDAYGKCDENKIQTVKKSQLKQFEDHGYKIEKGGELPTQYGMIKIKDVKGDNVTLDMNSPMCGKVLKFKVTVVKIQE